MTDFKPLSPVPIQHGPYIEPRRETAAPPANLDRGRNRVLPIAPAKGGFTGDDGIVVSTLEYEPNMPNFQINPQFLDTTPTPPNVVGGTVSSSATIPPAELEAIRSALKDYTPSEAPPKNELKFEKPKGREL